MILGFGRGNMEVLGTHGSVIRHPGGLLKCILGRVVPKHRGWGGLSQTERTRMRFALGRQDDMSKSPDIRESIIHERPDSIFIENSDGSRK